MVQPSLWWCYHTEVIAKHHVLQNCQRVQRVSDQQKRLDTHQTLPKFELLLLEDQ